MRVLQEVTVWPGSTPNHVYITNDSRDRLFAYVPVATGKLVTLSAPIPFETKGRKFVATENVWGYSEQKPTSKTWTVAGSGGNVYTIHEIGNKLTCSCPGFAFRKQCKHISANMKLGVKHD